ncbi:hypothetical protein SDC9_37149 [bioreactor metagenome]|uniref:Uncharacterized protein n=1 Tax=bioreactor metagenome TaxID=1076179 RepID=A0A644VIE3_9ZZZZ
MAACTTATCALQGPSEEVASHWRNGKSPPRGAGFRGGQGARSAAAEIGQQRVAAPGHTAVDDAARAVGDQIVVIVARSGPGGGPDRGAGQDVVVAVAGVGAGRRPHQRADNEARGKVLAHLLLLARLVIRLDLQGDGAAGLEILLVARLIGLAGVDGGAVFGERLHRLAGRKEEECAGAKQRCGFSEHDVSKLTVVCLRKITGP